MMNFSVYGCVVVRVCMCVFEVCALCLGGAIFCATEACIVLEFSLEPGVWAIMAKNSKSLGIPVSHMVSSSLLLRFFFLV